MQARLAPPLPWCSLPFHLGRLKGGRGGCRRRRWCWCQHRRRRRSQRIFKLHARRRARPPLLRRGGAASERTRRQGWAGAGLGVNRSACVDGGVGWDECAGAVAGACWVRGCMPLHVIVVRLVPQTKGSTRGSKRSGKAARTNRAIECDARALPDRGGIERPDWASNRCAGGSGGGGWGVWAHHHQHQQQNSKTEHVPPR